MRSFCATSLTSIRRAIAITARLCGHCSCSTHSCDRFAESRRITKSKPKLALRQAAQRSRTFFMRILHILDHSVPLHSGYAFRTLAILREQRALGWETFHLTSPKQRNCSGLEESVDGLKFFRTPAINSALSRTPVLKEMQLMQATARRLTEMAREIRPDILHAHSPVLNALPALKVARRLNVPM